VFCPREKWAESQKEERGGGGRGERKETLAEKPLDFENRLLDLSCLSATKETITAQRHLNHGTQQKLLTLISTHAHGKIY